MINKALLKSMLVVLVISDLVALFQLSIPYTLSMFIDNINHFGEAVKIIGLFFILTILLFLTSNIVKIIIEKNAYNLIDKIRTILLDKVLNADDDFFNNKSENEILEFFEVDLNKVHNFFANIVPSLFISAMTIIIIVGYLSVKVKFIFILFIVYVFIDAVLLKICNKNQDIVLKEANYHGEIDGKVGEWLNINNVIAHTNTSTNFIEKFMYMQNRLRKLKVDVNKYYYSIWCVSLMLGVLIDLSVLIFGGFLFFKKLISIGNLYLCYSYSKHLQSPLETLQQQFQYISEFKFSYKRIKTLLEETNEHNNELKDQGKIEINNINCIKLVHTKFSYNSTKLVLKDINLELNCGDVIGLIGDSGQGKSTLCKLLVKRLCDGQANVFINDINIADINISSIYKETIYLDNNPTIFQGTVMDNLLLFNKEKLNINIDLYQKYNLISIIGLNYDGIIDPETIDLKTAQLINVCRLFFIDKSLIILDEVISEVAIEICKKIMQLINQYLSNNIIINITHQHNKLLNCKCIYELKDGVLYEKA